MTPIEDLKALGFRQMHKVQIDALLDLIAVTLNLAALTNDQDVIEETEASCDELVRLFGGNGVELSINVH
jgi:hypothetical protein|tara:strand:- start:4856 stop:5065 length:210 start_codon:yes stop_codon:yes gene_type:complete